MRKFLIGIVTFILSATMVQAVPQQDQIVFIDISGGYRFDDLQWGVSAESGDDSFLPVGIEFLSKLKWSDLEMYQIMGTARMVTCDNYYFRLSGDYAEVYHGHHTDKDYIKTRCEKVQFLGARASSNSGEAFDLSAGIGYYFRFLGSRATIAPIAGYSHNEQHLHMSHLNIEFNDVDFITGHVPGLRSRYRSRWYGPWVGADFTLKMTHCLGLYISGEFHMARFRGLGHWNLRPDFVKDFKQRGGGYGQLYTFGINYDFTQYWKFGIVYNFQKWKTASGKMIQFFSGGREAELDLQSVRWVSQSIMANIEYVF